MSKRVFNPYRDLLDIPSLIDENPTDYQLLGVEDFESDPGKIAAAHEKRSQRIAELYQLVTEMSGKIDAARDRVTDSALKEDYDNDLRRKGLAGVAHLGKAGFCAVLFSFVLSIVIVIVSTFYVYPMIVAAPVENIGDSVTTLPNYNESQTKKEIELIKIQQEDVSTMDVNINVPIDADDASAVEFLEAPTEAIPSEKVSLEDLTIPEAPDQPVLEQPTQPEEPVLEQPEVEQPALPEVPAQPADEEPAVEQPSLPETPADEQPAEPELPVLEQPTPEEPALPETPADEAPVPEEPDEPEIPAVEEPAVEEPADEQQTIAKPSIEEPEVAEPAQPETPAVEEPSVEPVQPETPADEKPSVEPAVEEISLPELPTGKDVSVEQPGRTNDVPERIAISENRSAPDTPTVPKLADVDNTGIPELPPLDEQAGSDPDAAPLPPVIPELSAAAQAPSAPSPSTVSNLSTPGAPVAPDIPVVPNSTTAEPAPVANSNVIVTSQTPAESTPGVVLEDVDIVAQFVQLGQKARTNADFAQMINSAREVEANFVKKKDFQKAQQIADIVYAACARSADKTYRSEAYRYKDFISKRSQWWDSVRSAEAKMESNGIVSSADANLVARWKIEIDDDWTTALKYLALSENEQIRNAAKNEMTVNQADIRSVLIVANSWWNLAQYPIPMQRQFRAHASQWYAKALPAIADKQIRTLIEKRIAIAEQAVGSRQ